MSKIQVDEIVNAADDGGPEFSKGIDQGLSGWINFDGTGTLAIADSFNVDAVDDNGTGNYTINWSVAFANANYSGQTTGANDSTYEMRHTSGYTHTTTQYQIRCYQNTSSNVQDCARVSVAAFGEQA